eukprot:12220340-Alexandrium_andersonii.AAC.1
MSASLVGSEMCIRDSFLDSSCGLFDGPGVAQDAERQRAACNGGRERRRPVSYTHLTLPTICSV